MKRLAAALLLATLPCLAIAAPKKPQKPPAPPTAAIAPDLTVFAAASLTNALQDIGNLWMAAGNGRVVFSFAASSTLATQIEHGAPAAIFISADEAWMDDLAKHNAVAPGTRRDLLGNTLVLVEPIASLKPITLTPGVKLKPSSAPMAASPWATPSHVPAGLYAQQALQKLGIWPTLQTRLAPADSVRSALRLVRNRRSPPPASSTVRT